MAEEERLRAVGYARTSGEGQRDNTSIPNQKEAIEEFCRRNGWKLLGFYVDECRTGAKVAGRDDFQRMMRDGANGEYDIVVVFAITRFARDGFDIIGSSRTLKQDLGIDVVDTKRQYDTRCRQNVLANFVSAGVSEHERLTTMERTIWGRIRTARAGKPWCANPPIGRAYDKESGRWYVTEKGKAIAELLKRYVDGESLTAMCKEYGFPRRTRISAWVWDGQLAGTYKARFRSPEIDVDEEIPVPGIPEVITLALLEKVRARLRHNRRFNRHDKTLFKLSGFIRCADCRKALTGHDSRNGRFYYRHRPSKGCSVKGVRGDELEPAVLDHLYNLFLDEPAFSEAVLRAMPPVEHRQNLVNERTATAKRVAKNDRAIRRLVDAIADGVDANLLIEKQGELKAGQKALKQRLEQLENEIATLPSAEQIEAAAMLTRIRMIEEHKAKDWRELPYEDVKRFLFHLFGETTMKSETGMFVRRDQGNVVVSFRGQVDFYHEVVDGRPISKAMQVEAAMLNDAVSREYQQAIDAADQRLSHALDELGPFPDYL